MGIDLSKVTTEVKENAPGILLYSKAGLGKSTFAAQAAKDIPNSILFQCGEDSLTDLRAEDREGVPHYPDIIGGGADQDEQIDKFFEFGELLTSLIEDEHGYQCVVFDNLDNIITTNMDAFIVREYYDNKPDKANAYGGQKVEEMHQLCDQIVQKFKAIQAKGIVVLVTFHGYVVKSKDPLTDEYDTYTIAIPSRKDINVRDLFTNWASQTLFGTRDTTVADKKAKASERVLYSEESASYVAKNRFGIPNPISFDYQTFKRHYTGEVEKEEPKKKGGK